MIKPPPKPRHSKLAPVNFSEDASGRPPGEPLETPDRALTLGGALAPWNSGAGPALCIGVESSNERQFRQDLTSISAVICLNRWIFTLASKIRIIDVGDQNRQILIEFEAMRVER
jgi:hypothetical protein